MSDMTADHTSKSGPIAGLIGLHNSVAKGASAMAGVTLPTLARLAFAAVLLQFFWSSAGTKLDGIFTPSLGAYAQIFPVAMLNAGYDVSQLSAFHTIVVLLGSWAEYILPALVVVGLFTRLSALGMIGFVIVMSFVDITGHGADASTIGAWFDRDAASLILDQRTLWTVVLLTLVLKGAGPLSLDRIIGLK
jgi:putative oxidoreductase